jgi:hypothetical protein
LKLPFISNAGLFFQEVNLESKQNPTSETQGVQKKKKPAKMPAAPAPKEDAQPAPRKSQTMTRFSANEKEQMKTGSRTAYVALPKNLKARRATKPSVSHLD